MSAFCLDSGSILAEFTAQIRVYWQRNNVEGHQEIFFISPTRENWQNRPFFGPKGSKYDSENIENVSFFSQLWVNSSTISSLNTCPICVEITLVVT